MALGLAASRLARSGYALPPKARGGGFLILIDAEFSACLSLQIIVGSLVAVFGFLELAQNLSGLSDAAFARALYDQSWVRALFEIWPVVMVYVLPGIFAGTLCIFAASRDAPILWPTVGVFLILFLGFSYNLGVTPSLASDQDSWNIGVGIGFSTDWLLSIRILRFLIPLVLVLGPYYWWCQRQRKAMLA